MYRFDSIFRLIVFSFGGLISYLRQEFSVVLVAVIIPAIFLIIRTLLKSPADSSIEISQEV